MAAHLVGFSRFIPPFSEFFAHLSGLCGFAVKNSIQMRRRGAHRCPLSAENSAQELEMPTPTRQSSPVNQAFILGAGLGTRLRPLTDRLPKPLVPLFHRPLAEWTMAACARAGIHRFAINTHHLPEAWKRFVGRADVRGTDITLFHEPVLLETGGGLKNIGPWIGNKAVLVHNGDIFSTLHLDKLIAAHEASGLPVTLALRSNGSDADKRVALDESLTRVTDLRHSLGIAKGTHVFSGIYCVNPAFLELIPPGEVISVIPAFLALVKQNQLGAVVLDDGVWLDLGDRDSYLQAHRDLDLAPAIHPDAVVETGALVENSIVGPGAVISSGAIVRDSVIWPGGRVSGSAVLDRCIVCSNAPVSGNHQNEDL
jgi:NDP-sugar pyrophosphorylase family protein